MINTYVVTNASVHASDAPRNLLTENDKGQKVYGDSAYSGLGYLFERKGVIKEVCSKGQRCHPLTEEQKSENKRISKTRARVEHVFGFMEGAMHGLTCRLIGLTRAKVTVGLINFFTTCSVLSRLFVMNFAEYKRVILYTSRTTSFHLFFTRSAYWMPKLTTLDYQPFTKH